MSTETQEIKNAIEEEKPLSHPVPEGTEIIRISKIPNNEIIRKGKS